MHGPYTSYKGLIEWFDSHANWLKNNWDQSSYSIPHELCRFAENNIGRTLTDEEKVEIVLRYG